MSVVPPKSDHLQALEATASKKVNHGDLTDTNLGSATKDDEKEELPEVNVKSVIEIEPLLWLIPVQCCVVGTETISSRGLLDCHRHAMFFP